MRVMFLDPENEWIQVISEYLDDQFELLQPDTADLIESVRLQPPDILFLDMTFPGYDGITVLRTLRSLGFRPSVIAVSRYFSYYMEDILEELDVAYMMRKPCDPLAVASIITEVAGIVPEKRIRQPSVLQLAENMLLNLGLLKKHMGFACLVHIIPVAVERGAELYMKALYLDTAKVVSCSHQQVERGIRSAIEYAWKNRDERVWSMFFPPDKNGIVPLPSNSEFIHCLSQMIMKQIEV